MGTEDFKFKKKYGQNFLRSEVIPRRIVECSKIEANSLVIEVGPGAGILTKELASNPNVKQVIAYEIDTSLEELLDNNLIGFNNIEIIYDDFLNRDVVRDIEKFNYDHIYIVANLPYYITTPIIMKIIDSGIDIDKLVIMVQKEVADRFCASPKNKEYSSITVFLNYYFDIKKEFVVNRNLFIPKPNVDSMVISLNKKKEKYNITNKEVFFDLVRDSFKFKRKTLRNNLKGYDLDKVSEVLSKYHLDLTVRAEALPIEVFVDISNNL